jgi:hypothetical protein
MPTEHIHGNTINYIATILISCDNNNQILQQNSIL